MSRILKNQRIWQLARAAHARQSFHFQKVTGILKMRKKIENLQILSFYVKEQLLKNCNTIFFYFSKMGKRFLI